MRFIAALLILALSGCGIMQSSKDSAWVKKQRALNLDPYHVQSCGPEAIQKAFAKLGIYTDLENISHAIQKDPSCGALMRSVLSVFDKTARQITFPEEMKEILKKNGFTIVNIKSFKELNSEDTAIILISKAKTFVYHWACYPVDRNIESFFGKDTLIKEIYLIKKQS